MPRSHTARTRASGWCGKEVAHAVLHEGCADRGLAELEAESVAYVVCRHLGVDTGSYSFGYVASWAGGGAEAVAGLKASGARIQGAAAAILNQVEGEELAGEPGGTLGGSPGERLARPVVSGAVR